MLVKKGSMVKMEYVGTLDDGTEFDNSAKHGQLLEFEVGSGQVIKGFEDGVLGMKEGEEKNLTLPPDEAYGNRDDKLINVVPRSQLPPGQEPQVGMLLLVNLPTGQQMPAKIVNVTATDVSIDFNHPLAGETLHFKIKLVEIA